MRVRNSKTQFGAVAIGLHWLTALLILGVWTLGQTLDWFPRGEARSGAIVVHIGFGLAVLLTVLARFAWRLADPPPPLGRSRLGAWTNWAAEAVHYALYALLALAPIVGIATWFARGNALPAFGLVAIASPLAADRELARQLIDLHALLANAIVFLAGFHALAALGHHYLLRDDTLARMIPWMRPRAAAKQSLQA